ncbi:hypothetical protein B4U80_07281 [Leptotrombidium deliense]|uniref:C2H2-type domain-containing protein n=1 Tax=Leptotrombidium deliense TaxID=299467 RepID=A0A443SLW5_9ACAR|nr:hypothetical protein B4U80_07281 [Leptotrombidium deliense]
MENEKKRKCLTAGTRNDARMSAKCLFTPGHGVLLPDTGIYTCPTCNALFTCLQYYQQHVQRHAEVNGNKLLCCNHCRYSTDNQFHYNWHIMSHTGEPPHSCNVCNKPPESALNSTSNHIKSETETDDDVTYAMTGKRSVATATNDDIVLMPSSPMSCRLSGKEDQNRNCSATQAGSYASTTTQVKRPPYTKSPTSTPSSIPAPVENSTGRGRGKGNRKSRTLNMLESGVDGSVAGELRLDP